MGDEINITIASINGQTDTLSLSSSSTSLQDLTEFAVAILGISSGNSSHGRINLIKDGRTIFTTNAAGPNTTLGAAGLQNGDLVLVSVAAAATTTTPTNNNRPTTQSSSGMALDFSSLLHNRTPASRAAATAASNTNNNNTGLTFHIPGLGRHGGATTPVVEWDGMTLDDAIERNANPDALVKILFNDTQHPNVMKELNYHSPVLAQQLKDAGKDGAAKIWRANMMKGALSRTLDSSQAKNVEQTMTAKLRTDPMDEEANKYFGEKIRKDNVEAQYRQMMESYPESMGRVLMLYIDAEVNSHRVQMFVDSGAQSTIMSASAAERCGLLHLLDTRFAGVAVGVGTGTILGRVHIAQIKVGGRFYPCSITVMDDGGKGLGDKNMEFLFGLDMLKRHRCNIDLQRNRLVFGTTADGVAMETSFLHEKDLDETKGGTKGFDADKSNKELQKVIEDSMKKEEGGNDDKMDVEDDDKKRGT